MSFIPCAKMTKVRFGWEPLMAGLIQIRDEKITALTDREGLNGEVFRSLHQDDSGALWIGGYGVS